MREREREEKKRQKNVTKVTFALDDDDDSVFCQLSRFYDYYYNQITVLFSFLCVSLENCLKGNNVFGLILFYFMKRKRF